MIRLVFLVSARQAKIKIDGERVERLTRKIREERVDGWTYRKVVEQMLVDGDVSESGGCNLAQVTPSIVASMAPNGGVDWW